MPTRPPPTPVVHIRSRYRVVVELVIKRAVQEQEFALVTQDDYAGYIVKIYVTKWEHLLGTIGRNRIYDRTGATGLSIVLNRMHSGGLWLTRLV